MYKKIYIFFMSLFLMACFISNAFADCSADEIDVLGDGTQCETAKFTVTSTSSTTTFLFRLSAAGTFYVDWGDGVVEPINRANDVTLTDYPHNYDTAGAYTIRFAGNSTAYSEGETTPVITFYKSSGGTQANVAKISGSLGALFPTLTDGSRPRFYQTFRGCSNLVGPISANLFAGVTGAPLSYMFAQTFYQTSKLTSAIPAGLFSGIVGAPAPYMFSYTFYYSHISSFPAGLFSGISGAPAANMYDSTFSQCRWISSSTTIPSAFFGTFDGPPAPYMFNSTFLNVFNLSGPIPENLFAGIVGAPAPYMFTNTFADARKLSSIPENLFAGISGAPATRMFSQTFYGVSATSIPENLFKGISGPAASHMFYSTFYNCSKMTGFVSPKLFAGITGTASNMMAAVFGGSNSLDTVCPDDYSQYITGFESYWNGKVSCYKCENDNELAYQNGCLTPCGTLKNFHVGDVSYPLFAEYTHITSPVLNIKQNDTICYMYFESGNTNGLNIKMPNGNIYHATDPTTPKYRCVNSGGTWDKDTEICLFDSGGGD